jgi:hypothetical protein
LVTVPAGSATAEFMVPTSSVATDTHVTVVASLDDLSVRSTLAVWPIASTSFWYDISPTGERGIDAVGRYTSDTLFFRATCDLDGIYVEFSRPDASLRLPPISRWEVAMWGIPMRPGTFDVLPGLDAPPPRLRINGPSIFNGLSYVCSTGKARVVVEELEYRTTGEVDRFVARIEQQCDGPGERGDRFRGEIRLTHPPRPAGGVPPGRCIR